MIKYFRAGYSLFKACILITRYSDITKNVYYKDLSLWIKLWIFICGGYKQHHNLAKALEKMGPAYIKIGQFFATRSDILPPHLTVELSKLQDKVPPFPRQIALNIVQEEFGNNEIFIKFSEPIAAASVAQVHFATLTDGMQVAVKILRPNIHKKFAKDIESFKIGTNLVHYLFKRIRRLKLPQIVNTLEEWVRDELDLRMEAAATSEFKEKTYGDHKIYVPQVYWDYTTNKVFTMERISGYPLTHITTLRNSSLNLSHIAEHLFSSFIYHATFDGIFHGDLHQGNIIIMPDSTICFIDFGILGRLDNKSAQYLAQILYGFVKRDYYHIAKLHFQAGYVPQHHNIHRFSLALRSIGEPIFGKSANQISMARFLSDLFKVTESFDMETRQELILLQKNLVTLEGTARTLDENIDIWKVITPILEKWVKENLSIKTKIQQTIVDLAEKFDSHFNR